MTRIATLVLPLFGIQAVVRERPELQHRALALEGLRPLSGRVAECTPSAQSLGVSEGQTLARARAACPNLVVVKQDEALLARVREEIVEALQQVAPHVEWAGDGTFHLDATGMERWHGSEHALLASAVERMQSLGLMARAACAGSKLAGNAAAHARAGITVVPEGGEARLLGPLPLSELPLPRAAVERLALLGVRTLGQLAALPPDGLVDRFGPLAARWRRLARGEDIEPLVPAPSRETVRAVRDLDHPITGLEPALFLLKSCASELADELERRGLVAVALELALALDDGSLDTRALRPASPTSLSRVLLDLCRFELEARPLRAPLAGLALTIVEEAPAQGSSGDLFGRTLDESAVVRAVARLRALLGEESVVTPAPVPAWRREERRGWKPWRLPAGGAVVAVAAESDVLGPAPPRGSERLLVKPLPARVQLARGSGEPGEIHVPAAERGAAEACGLPGRAIVVAQEGPLRLSGEWWEGDGGVDRDEWRLLTAEGGILHAIRNRRDRSWSLLGFED